MTSDFQIQLGLEGIGLRRIARIKRMRMIDAGTNPFQGLPHIARFSCSRCSTESDWMQFRTISEINRGIPCPTCNLGAPATDQNQSTE